MRGYFVETYNAGYYAEAGIDAVFVQDNESCSQKGVLHGLHWQAVACGAGKNRARDLLRREAVVGCDALLAGDLDTCGAAMIRNTEAQAATAE